MSAGTIIAISIIVASILMLFVVGMISYNRMKPTFRNFKNLNAQMKQKKDFYNRESDHLTNQLQELKMDLDSLQREVELKSVHFQDFSNEQGNFQTSLRYLQDHAGGYSKGIASNLKDEAKRDGPKIIESFKRAFKKTAHKQKERRKKNKKAE